MNKTKPCHCCTGTGKELDHAAVGASMRRLRTARGLSLQEISRRLDLSLSYVSDLERGRRNWNDELVERFKRACV